MYGVPGQTQEMVLESIQTVLSWGLEHLSLYGLKLEENTPLYDLKPTLPDDDSQADTYLAAVELLKSEGFLQYEISNFALSGFHCRHNMKYWTLSPYVGFGASAHSDLSGKRYAYIRDAEGYIDGIENRGDIMSEMSEVRLSERAGEYIMLGLRTSQGISSNEYTRLFNVSFDTVEKKLEKYAADDFCEQNGDRWRLTPKGFFLSNKIIGDLLTVDDIK